MKGEEYFFLVFIATILITRIFLYIHPLPAPTIKDFRIHHYMYGLILAAVGALFGNITIYAIGVGLFVDELGYLLIGGKTHKENYSTRSLILLGVFVVLVYAFKKQFLFFET